MGRAGLTAAATRGGLLERPISNRSMIARMRRQRHARSHDSPTNQYGDLRVGQHLVRHTADEERGKPATPMP